jgi:predicted TIM-barrel fold metal-dependent hydrolase
LIAQLFERGVRAVVLMNYAHRPGVSEWLNEFSSALIRQIPGSAAALGAVHPQDDDPAAVVHRAFDVHGLSGVKMHAHVQAVAPDDPAMFPIYEAVLSHDGVVNFHAGREPAIEAYGYDVHSVSGADRVRPVLRRYPQLKMIVPHLGMDEAERFFDLLDEFPNLYLDTAMVVGDYFGFPVDRDRLERHADRILYGTDYPHIPYPVETELLAFKKLGLSPRAERAILFENAARLFSLH